jgi:hypothetical protein
LSRTPHVEAGIGYVVVQGNPEDGGRLLDWNGTKLD